MRKGGSFSTHTLWVDWKHSETEYAYSEQVDGEWMPPVFLPWTDDSWVRAEEARKAIRTIIETGP